MSSWEVLFDQDHMGSPFKEKLKTKQNKTKSIFDRKENYNWISLTFPFCVYVGFVVIQIKVIPEKSGVEVPVWALLITLVDTAAPASN